MWNALGDIEVKIVSEVVMILPGTVIFSNASGQVFSSLSFRVFGLGAFLESSEK